ncbi:MAG: flippase-like domain-containing protein [Anaerolineae bacterium]|nr:flippase-like domain-containing protein [Anaerolineae bacterium]
MNSESGKPVGDGKPNWANLARVAGSLLSAGFLVYLIGSQGWQEVLDAFRQIRLPALILAFGLVLLSRVSVTLRWYALLRSANQPLGLTDAFKITFTGLFASNFLPSTVGGDLVRMAGALVLRLDAGVSAASLVVDRLVGMAGMALMLPAGITAVAAAQAAVLPAAAGLIPGGLWGKVKKFANSLIASSIYWLRHPRGLVLAFLCTLAHMLLTFLTVSTLLSGLGFSAPLWLVGGLWSFSYFVSLAPISINGFGLQEVSIAYLYSTFAGASLQAGLALAILMRVLFMAASLPGALFWTTLRRARAQE